MVFIFEDYESSLKMIRYLTKHENKSKKVIVFNNNLFTENKFHNELINSKLSNLQIYVYKFSNNVSVV